MRPSFMTAIAALGLLIGAFVTSSVAQQAGPNVQRDCQTVRTCNFARTGAVRGCLSSFSCRACRPVAVKCTLPGAGGSCRQLRCDWGA
jgi:hypothetical protein